MSPVYDFWCACGSEKIDMICKMDEGVICDKCFSQMKRKCNCTHFKLIYNNRTDLCDWQGNSSRYWDDVKAARERGEKVKGVTEN